MAEHWYAINKSISNFWFIKFIFQNTCVKTALTVLSKLPLPKPASHIATCTSKSKLILEPLLVKTYVTSSIDWDSFTDWVLSTFVGLHHQRPGGAGPSADDWGGQEHQGQTRPGEKQDGGRDKAGTELPGPAGSQRKVQTLTQALCSTCDFDLSIAIDERLSKIRLNVN